MENNLVQKNSCQSPFIFLLFRHYVKGDLVYCFAKTKGLSQITPFCGLQENCHIFEFLTSGDQPLQNKPLTQLFSFFILPITGQSSLFCQNKRQRHKTLHSVGRMELLAAASRPSSANSRT